MKTLHFVFLNNRFVSVHVDVRFTHYYWDIVEDKDYSIFIRIPGLFMRLGQIKRFPCVARAKIHVVHLQVLNQPVNIGSSVLTIKN